MVPDIMRVLQSCPACGSPDIVPAYTGRTTRNPADPATWHLVRCQRCDHGFLNPQPDWSDLEPYYTSSYAPYAPDHGVDTSAVELARATGEYRHVKIRAGMRILDVGCGGGSFLRVARELGATVAGVEPSPSGAKAASEQGLDVFHGRLEDYAQKVPESVRWDLITFSHVVEHLPEPNATLAVAGRLLAPGGRVWVAVPNGACRAARSLGWRWHSTDLPIHLHQFSTQSLRKAVEGAGLLVDRIYTYSFPPAAHASLIAMARKWGVPVRVSGAIVPMSISRWFGRRADNAGRGEAIIAEMIPKTT
jgi:SAM-dependent methyltransferase